MSSGEGYSQLVDSEEKKENFQIDKAEATKQLKDDSATLLQDGELVEMAFNRHREQIYFTTHRIIFRCKRGLNDTKVMYKSVPYVSIKGFSVQPAGESIEGEKKEPLSAVGVWAMGVGYISMNFIKSVVDPFSIYRYLNCKVLSTGPNTTMEPPAPKSMSDLRGIFKESDLQADAAAAEHFFKHDLPLLDQKEKVLLAFKSHEGIAFFTPERLLVAEFQDKYHTQIVYRTALLTTLRAMSFESNEGLLEKRVNVRLWTNIGKLRLIKLDLRDCKEDLIMTFEKFIGKLLLGDDTKESARSAAVNKSKGEGTLDMLAKFPKDLKQFDETVINKHLHENAPILQGCEVVEMAFKGSHEEVLIFTTKRLLVMSQRESKQKIPGAEDTKEPIKKIPKIDFVTYPWTTVQAFTVLTNTEHKDVNCEMRIWTDIMHEPATSEAPARPGVATFKKEFNVVNVDIMNIHRYLSERCLRAGHGSTGLHAQVDPSPVARQILEKGPPDSIEKMMKWLKEAPEEVDPKEVDTQLHSTCPMLQSDEHVLMAFKVNRSATSNFCITYNTGHVTTLLTGKRCIVIDVYESKKKMIQYKSVPLTSVRAFSVVGTQKLALTKFSTKPFAEVKLYMNAHWDQTLTLRWTKGLADIAPLQRFLSQLLFDKTTGAVAPSASPASLDEKDGVKTLVKWLFQTFKQTDSAGFDTLFHGLPAFLLDGEKVETAFNVGKELLVLTDRRLLNVERQTYYFGMKWTVAYQSIPLTMCTASLAQTTSSRIDFDAASGVYTDVPGLPKVGHDLRNGKFAKDKIFDYEKTLASTVLKYASSEHKSVP